MLDFKIKKNHQGQQQLETCIHGKALMSISQLNKGLAFTHTEREMFGLKGKLPNRVESLEEQANRAYLQFSTYQKKINKNIYLRELLNTNQVLFYKLLSEHLEEMIPIIYTPIVGYVVQEYNERFSQPRGLYISYEDRDNIETLLNNRTNPEIKLIVVSDGEGVLGIGDQGIGAMAIPVAKLMVYTAFAGIDPMNTLPVLLDPGTNNQALLKDPYYLGWRHERVTGHAYDSFIEKFVTAVKKTFTPLFLHWEDFGRHNAYQNLAKYRKKITSFNDDIQGTGVVALAAVLAAMNHLDRSLKTQRFVIYGAGTAGMGVTHSIYNALRQHGLSEEDARSQFYLVDRYGLVTETTTDITPAQKPFARKYQDLVHWKIKNKKQISLIETIEEAKPHVLIGCSAQQGAFTQTIIKAMLKHTKKPVILPLSNPTEKSEATPEDLLKWTDGQVLIATGSPFPSVTLKNKTYSISQCNNYLAFPGIGLSVLTTKASHVSSSMLWAASKALSEFADQHRLLPAISEVQTASLAVAKAVSLAAIDAGLSSMKKTDLESQLKHAQWTPAYLPYQYIKT